VTAAQRALIERADARGIVAATPGGPSVATARSLVEAGLAEWITPPRRNRGQRSVRTWWLLRLTGV
jgi:hypothetical protein